MTRSELQRAPRAALQVAYVLLQCPGGATYEGLRVALGLSSDSGVRGAVRRAKGAGLVVVVSFPGRGGAAVIRLREPVRRLLAVLFRPTPHLPERPPSV